MTYSITHEPDSNACQPSITGPCSGRSQKIKISFLPMAMLLIALSCQKQEPPFQRELARTVEEAGQGLPYFQGKDMNPVWDKSRTGLRRLGDFSLVNDAGASVTLKEIQNTFVIVSFFYTTCRGICPRLIGNVATLLPEIQQQADVTMLSFSIDPEMDTPQKIREFKRLRHIPVTSRWLFLTGDKESIHQIARGTFNADTFTRSRTKAIDFVHSENVYLLDKELYLRGVYRGQGTAIQKILTDIAKLRKEQTGALDPRFSLESRLVSR